MMQIALIGLGAGAAAALLFASVISGSLLSLILVCLAPLPLMIAGLGWTHWSTLTGVLVAAAALGLIVGWPYMLAFIGDVGAPAWVLVYLAMLARPVETAEGPTLEWYPPGRLVAWSAILGTMVVLVAVAMFGLDSDAFRASLAKTFMRMLGGDGKVTTIPGVSDPQRFIDFMVEVVPLATAVLSTLKAMFNLWLAGRIVKTSGRLVRPWPELSAMTMPLPVAALLAGALLLSFSGGMPGIVAGALACSLIVAYGVLGFAVLHAVTRGMNARPFLIGSAYGAVLVFGWPVLLLMVLGLIDVFTGLRARVARRRDPTVHS